MSSGDYLHMPTVVADRREADYNETVPKTVAFGGAVSEYQRTTSSDDATRSYAMISRSTRPSAGNRATATSGATTTSSPGAVPPPLPSPPHTLHSHSDANEPGYIQLDFRSTSQSSRDRRNEERDDNNNNLCRRCRHPLQPDDGFDSEGVHPTFNNCTIYNLHIYSNKRQCEEYYDNISEKQQQRQRLEREQHQLREQEQQQDDDRGGVDNYVAFARRSRLSSHGNLYDRRRPSRIP